MEPEFFIVMRMDGGWGEYNLKRNNISIFPKNRTDKTVQVKNTDTPSFGGIKNGQKIAAIINRGNS